MAKRTDEELAKDVYEKGLGSLSLGETIRFSFNSDIAAEVVRLREAAEQTKVQNDFARELQDQTFAVSASEVMAMRGFGTIFEGSSPSSMANLATVATGRAYTPMKPPEISNVPTVANPPRSVNSRGR